MEDINPTVVCVTDLRELHFEQINYEFPWLICHKKKHFAHSTFHIVELFQNGEGTVGCSSTVEGTKPQNDFLVPITVPDSMQYQLNKWFQYHKPSWDKLRLR